ncbi:MAG: transglycosylase domain-containing protein, partial [Anaerolineae bacterium]|nr:transglycosylase domain-containing protein [Anaerolineae bacterium]
QEDPGATLVSQNAAFMEPMRPSDAPTQARSRQVEADAAGYVAHPAGSGIPPRPEQEEVGDLAGDLTIRSSAVAGAAQQVESPRPIPVPQQQTQMPVGSDSAAAARQQQTSSAAPSAQVQPPKQYRLGEYPQPDYSEAFGGARNHNAYLRWGVRIVVVGIIFGMFLTLVVLLGMIGYYLYEVDRYSEAVASLTERAADFENTLILDSSGITLAEFSNPDTGLRTEVPLNEISPWLIHATVSTENETFYTDPGFSILAIVRAAFQNVREGDTVSGASTITQQLARALVLETEFASQRTTQRKIVEIIVASEIKRNYDKNEILEIYLNEIFYGNFAYGIEAAARTYFNKTAAELNPAEAAFLAGLPQSPATYDPVVNHEAAIYRMREVLRLMAEANGTGCIYIQHDDTTGWGAPAGSGLCVRSEQGADGSSIYYYKDTNTPDWTEMTLDITMVEIASFSRPAVEYIHPHFVNYVWQQLEDEYGPQRIYSAGFHVTTTLNESIQSAAEQAVTSNLASLQAQGRPAENASVVVIRPADGAVLAMVGSADYHNESIDGQVNVAFTGQQPGSSLKPFVYLASFMPDAQGDYLTPASVLWDVYTDFNGYVPTNYDGYYHGPETVRSALGNSYNVPAVKALQFVTVERFTAFAKSIGLTFPLGDPVERNAGLPTALGAVEVRLFDMVATYAMLANNGQPVYPYSIISVTDNDGNPVEWIGAEKEEKVTVPPEYAYLITSILSDNQARAEEFGYGAPMELANNRIAAVKTGTSNDNRDAWTVGYTPQMAVGVWVGNTDNTPVYGLTGYYGAAPIWNEVMEAAHVGLNVNQFARPSTIVDLEVCNDSGVLAFQACAGQTHWDVFASSVPPPGPEKHIFTTLQVDDYSGKLVNEYCSDMPVTKTYLNVDDEAALAWLKTDAGAAWLAARNVEVENALPPTESCLPNEARPVLTITSPQVNLTASGIVPVLGTISMIDFKQYEIFIAATHDPQSFDELIGMQASPPAGANASLGQIDTTRYANGPYTVRVIAYDNQGRDITRDIPITISNAAAPTAVPAVPTATLAPTLTPVSQLPVATDPAQDLGPTAIPTITPTWTLSPTP